MVAAAATGISGLAVPPASARPNGQTATPRHGHEAKAKPCKKRHRNHYRCRHPVKPTTPASHPAPLAPTTPNPTGPVPTTPPAPPPPGTGNTSPAAQFAIALVGTTYERYTSSSSGSDFTDDYMFCSNDTFLEHTESYAAGSYVVGDYNGTWSVTNALSATSADVAYTTTNPNLPSSGAVSITILSNGITVNGNGYYIKGPASC